MLLDDGFNYDVKILGGRPMVDLGCFITNSKHYVHLNGCKMDMRKQNLVGVPASWVVRGQRRWFDPSKEIKLSETVTGSGFQAHCPGFGTISNQDRTMLLLRIDHQMLNSWCPRCPLARPMLNFEFLYKDILILVGNSWSNVLNTPHLYNRMYAVWERAVAAKPEDNEAAAYKTFKEYEHLFEPREELCRHVNYPRYASKITSG